MTKYKTGILLFVCFLTQFWGIAQIPEVPGRQEGEGPWPQLIIRGVILVNSTGSPPLGPVDIVVENNRITDIRVVGTTGLPIEASRRPQLKPGGKELDAAGMYLMPGFVDTHAHIGGNNGADASYVYKLWMAHGVTTIREPSAGNGLEWTLDQKKKSEKNTITAPRIKAYTRFGMGSKTPIATAKQARDWVKQNAKAGADGIKFFGAAPEIMQAAAEENKKLGLRSAIHHAQTDVARWNALSSAKAGISSLEHWYGLPEAMFTDRTIQHYSLDYNYTNEQDRFGDAGTLWKQAAAPNSEKWNKVMDELIALDFTLNPTFNIYEANRDLMRARRAEWHEDYTMPELWKFYEPSWNAHGSYWHSWGTEQEVQWRENFRLWMAFVNEFKNRGGRVTVGTDSGFIYELFGFAYPREMELLREAGFHPLEVIQAATLNGAELLGMEKEIGSVEIGKLADFVIVEENPLKDFKVLYGTGAIRLVENNKVTRVGGVKYTIKDGIIYDAKELLAQVKKMVAADKEKKGFKIMQPGVDPHQH